MLKSYFRNLSETNFLCPERQLTHGYMFYPDDYKIILHEKIMKLFCINKITLSLLDQLTLSRKRKQRCFQTYLVSSYFKGFFQTQRRLTIGRVLKFTILHLFQF